MSLVRYGVLSLERLGEHANISSVLSVKCVWHMCVCWEEGGTFESSLIKKCLCSHCTTGVEIDDEQAEKIFTANDAIELLKNKLDVH